MENSIDTYRAVRPAIPPQEDERLKSLGSVEMPYSLNKDKALRKKVAGHDAEDFTVIQTGGGVRLKMNTAMYELFKFTAEEYFDSSDLNCTVNKTHVRDARGLLVETRYKVSTNQCNLYTANLYHTTSSCLVNGCNTEVFMDSDLIQIITNVEKKLTNSDISLDSLNAYIKSVLNGQSVNYDDCNDSAGKQSVLAIELCDNSDLPQSEIFQQSDNEITISHTQDLEKEDENPITEINCLKENEGEQKHESIRAIHAEINDMKHCLQQNLNEYRSQISRLQDEVCSIKKHISLLNDRSLQSITSLDERTKQISVEVSTYSESVCRRLQSIADMIRSKGNYHCRNNTSNNQSSSGVTPSRDGIISTNSGLTPTRCAVTPTIDGVNPTCGMIIPTHTCREANQSSYDFTPTRGGVDQTRVGTTPPRNGGSQTRSGITRTNGANATEFPTLPSLSPIRNQAGSDHIHEDTCATKTLLVGSSILKGISKRGLSYYTDVESISGAKIGTIAHKLRIWDLSVYSTIIIYVGGNDISLKDPQTIYTDLKHIVDYLQDRSITVYLCTLCPRTDVDVVPTNDALKQLSQDRQTELIDIYSSFIYGDGKEAVHFYAHDQIHLNKNGCRALISAINRCVPIIKATQHATNQFSVQERASVSYDRTTPDQRTSAGGYRQHPSSDGYAEGPTASCYQQYSPSVKYQQNTSSAGGFRYRQNQNSAGYVRSSTNAGYRQNKVSADDHRHNPDFAGNVRSTTNVGYHQHVVSAGGHRQRPASAGYFRNSTTVGYHQNKVLAGDHRQNLGSAGGHGQTPATAGYRQVRSSTNAGFYQNKVPAGDYRQSPASTGRFRHEPDHRQYTSYTGPRQVPVYDDYHMRNHWTRDCRRHMSRKLTSSDLYRR